MYIYIYIYIYIYTHTHTHKHSERVCDTHTHTVGVCVYPLCMCIQSIVHMGVLHISIYFGPTATFSNYACVHIVCVCVYTNCSTYGCITHGIYFGPRATFSNYVCVCTQCVCVRARVHVCAQSIVHMGVWHMAHTLVLQRPLVTMYVCAHSVCVCVCACMCVHTEYSTYGCITHGMWFGATATFDNYVCVRTQCVYGYTEYSTYGCITHGAYFGPTATLSNYVCVLTHIHKYDELHSQQKHIPRIHMHSYT
jgi:hypothetical protein